MKQKIRVKMVWGHKGWTILIGTRVKSSILYTGSFRFWHNEYVERMKDGRHTLSLNESDIDYGRFLSENPYIYG